MYKHTVVFKLFFIALLSAQLAAQDLQDIENKQILSDLKKAQEKFFDFSEKKKSQCIKSIGHKDFCTCIIANSPLGVDFFDYVAITNTGLNEIRDNIEPEKMEIITNTRKARDKCVLEVFGMM